MYRYVIGVVVDRRQSEGVVGRSGDGNCKGRILILVDVVLRDELTASGEFHDFAWPTQGLSPVNQNAK